MNFTYDLNTNGCLILTADAEERELIREATGGEYTRAAECDALESLIVNSELEWINPEEIGALTDAPILGFHDTERELPANVSREFVHITGGRDGKVFYEPVRAAWGFMDYQVRSFLQDLVETGKAVFIS